MIINEEIKTFLDKFSLDDKNKEKIINSLKDLKKINKYYVKLEHLKEILKKKLNEEDLFFGGESIASQENNNIIPSYTLLNQIEKYTNKLILDEKTSWLFICGRDIFKENVPDAPKIKDNQYIITTNQKKEILGVAIKQNNLFKNYWNIGDFLKREK